MQTMTEAEWIAFLSAGQRTAKVATIREDGSPHIAPVWFVLDGRDILFTTWHTTVKAKNLRRDARLAICVDDDRLPYAFVQIEGRAIFVPGADELLKWATKLAGRYVGPAQAEAFGKRNGVEGELLVRVTPMKVIARTGIAD